MIEQHQGPGWQDRVAADYLEKGLCGKLTLGANAAIVLVDLINGFTDSSFPTGSDFDSVVQSTALLLETGRKHGIPVFFTTIAFSPSMVEDHQWLKKMPAMKGLLEGTRWVSVDERIAPADNEPVVVKRAASAFGGTELMSLLIAKKVDSVIICGATTSGCIRATVVDACMLGLPAFVVSECVGDRAPEPHYANLFDIDAKYGDVVSPQEMTAALSNRGKATT